MTRHAQPKTLFLEVKEADAVIGVPIVGIYEASLNVKGLKWRGKKV